MAAVRGSPLLRLPMLAPVVGVLVLAVAWRADLNVVLLVLVAMVLAGSVLAAVHHAEVVAHVSGSRSDPWCSRRSSSCRSTPSASRVVEPCRDHDRHHKVSHQGLKTGLVQPCLPQCCRLGTRRAATTRRTPTGTGRVRPWFRRSGGRSRPLAVCRRACRLQARSPARSARLADGECSRQARPPGAGYSGMFPCFLGGRVSRFERRRRSERTISERVSWGAMTAST